MTPLSKIGRMYRCGVPIDRVKLGEILSLLRFLNFCVPYNVSFFFSMFPFFFMAAIVSNVKIKSKLQVKRNKYG